MNTLRMKGNWNETVGKLKQQLANLTNDDGLFNEGKDEDLGRIQQKLGRPKKACARWLRHDEKSFSSALTARKRPHDFFATVNIKIEMGS